MHKIYFDTSVFAYYYAPPSNKAEVNNRKYYTAKAIDKIKSFDDAKCCTSELTLLELYKSGISNYLIEEINSNFEILKPNYSTESIYQNFHLTSEHTENYRFSEYHVSLALSNKCPIIVSWMMPESINYDQFQLIDGLAKLVNTECPLVCNPEQLIDYMHIYTDDVHESVLSTFIDIEMDYYENHDGDSDDSFCNFHKYIESSCNEVIKVNNISDTIDKLSTIDFESADIKELICNEHLWLKKRDLYAAIWHRMKRDGIPVIWSVIRDKLNEIVPSNVPSRDNVVIRYAQGILQAAGKYKYTNERRRELASGNNESISNDGDDDYFEDSDDETEDNSFKTNNETEHDRIMKLVCGGRLSIDRLELILLNKSKLALSDGEIQMIKDQMNTRSNKTSRPSGRLSDYIIS